MEDKNRMINTRIWSDGYVSNLQRDEKLVFIYLLTNPFTSICGIYEIPFKHISVDLDIDINTVKTILKKFETDEKILISGNWIALKNFNKHQRLKGDKAQIGISRAFLHCPAHLVKWVKKQGENDTLSTGYAHPSRQMEMEMKMKMKREGGKSDKIVEYTAPPSFSKAVQKFKTVFKSKTGRELIVDDFKVKDLEQIFNQVPKHYDKMVDRFFEDGYSDINDFKKFKNDILKEVTKEKNKPEVKL